MSSKDVLLLVQRVLALVRSTFYTTNMESWRIAWSRPNPKLKSLDNEDYEKRETNLFGPGFLEKAKSRQDLSQSYLSAFN